MSVVAHVLFGLTAIALLTGLGAAQLTPVGSVTVESEYWFQSAVFDALVASPFNAQTIGIDIYGNGYAPWPVLFGWLGNAFGWDAPQTMAAAGIGGLGLFIVGAYLFSRAYWHSVWAPVTFLLIFFGTWFAPINHAGFFALTSLVFSPNDPGFVALAFGLLLWWACLKAVDRPLSHVVHLGCIAIFAAGAILSDPFTGIFAVAVGALMVLKPALDISRMSRISALAAVVIGITASTQWIYFNPLEIIATFGPIRTLATVQGFGYSLTGTNSIFLVSGLAVVGLIGFISLRAQRIRWEILLPLIATTIGALVAVEFASWVQVQFVALVIICLQLGLVSFFFQPSSRSEPPVATDLIRGLLLATLCVALGFNAFAAYDSHAKAAALMTNQAVTDIPNDWDGQLPRLMAEVEDMIDGSPNVIAYRHAALPFTAPEFSAIGYNIARKPVTSMSDAEIATGSFFSDRMSKRRRCEIIAQFEIGLIAYRTGTISKTAQNALPAFGRVKQMGQMVLIPVTPGQSC